MRRVIAGAAAHDAGRYTDVGRELIAMRAALSRLEPGGSRRLQLALRFWSHWSQACNGNRVAATTTPAKWPRLARALAAHLSLGDDMRDSFTCVDIEQKAPRLVVDKASRQTAE